MNMDPWNALSVANCSMRTGYSATFVTGGLMKTEQTQRETLFFINMMFANIKDT
jgi:hypothetical protein